MTGSLPTLNLCCRVVHDSGDLPTPSASQPLALRTFPGNPSPSKHPHPHKHQAPTKTHPHTVH